MNVITFFQQQHVLVRGCLCTIKGIIFANQIDVSVTVDIDVFDIRNGKIGFGICNSWFRDVATAGDAVRSVVISTGTVVRLIVVIVSTATFYAKKLFVSVQTFSLGGSGCNDIILFHINGCIKLYKTAGVL